MKETRRYPGFHYYTKRLLISFFICNSNERSSPQQINCFGRLLFLSFICQPNDRSNLSLHGSMNGFYDEVRAFDWPQWHKRRVAFSSHLQKHKAFVEETCQTVQKLQALELRLPQW